VHLHLPAEEEDGDAVVGEVSEAPCTGFNGLYLAVEPLGDGVGDRVRTMRQQSADVPLEHLRHLNHRREA